MKFAHSTDDKRDIIFEAKGEMLVPEKSTIVYSNIPNFTGRNVPIVDCIYPFFKNWYNIKNKKCDYLLNTPSGERFMYRNNIDAYFIPRMQKFKLSQTPHCCRHTSIYLLAEAKVDATTIKKIVGHAGAMSLT